MPLLVVLKRFEIWLLLVVVGALIYVALQPVSLQEEEEPIAATVAAEPEETPAKIDETETKVYPAIALDSISVEKSDSGSGSLVEITLLARSNTDTEVSDSAITAVTATGEPVRRFFEPFQETAMLFPDEESLVTTRWWVEKPTDTLWLELQGQRIEAPLSE